MHSASSTAQSGRLRILLYNVGYETGIDGSRRSYLLRFYRYLRTPQRIMRKVRHSIYQLLNSYKPDLCCFVEIRSKRGALHPRFYAYSDAAVKYGPRSILRRLPMFRDNCNGFLSHKPFTYRKLYFKSGTKKLIYEIQLTPDLRVLLVHLSLRQRTRRKQFQELAKIVDEGCPAIICGDFNVFKGAGEVAELAKKCALRVVNGATEMTFPAAKPKRTLDLFLCPESVTDAKVTVLEHMKVSDHLPVLLEIG
jgi:hypothetical protein